MPNKAPLTETIKLLQRLDKAGGQGLDLDRLPDRTDVVRSLVRSGRAHISFGRLYVSRRCVPQCAAEDHVEVAPAASERSEQVAS